MPAGTQSQTGYQYESVPRGAGQRELAPPSNPSKDGGLRKSVLMNLRESVYCTPASASRLDGSAAKFVNSMVSSALPTSRVSTMLNTCLGTEMPSWISYLRMNATFLMRIEGFFTR